MTKLDRNISPPQRKLNLLLAQPAPVAAPALIGWRVSAHGVTGMIAETEAYSGEDDLACHASKGRTPRSATLYAGPGTIYIYLCYGMHHMLNLVTDREGMPAAVLIRGLIIDDLDPRRSNGPGKVARLLGLDRSHNGSQLGSVVHLAPPDAMRAIPVDLCTGPRVGVEYAGAWSTKPWRWWVRGFPTAKAFRSASGGEQAPLP